VEEQQKQKVSDPAQNAYTSSVGGYEPKGFAGIDLPPDIHRLQDLLAGQRAFEPADVKLETKVIWKGLSPPRKHHETEVELVKEERSELQVTIKRLDTAHQFCFVALGFDTPFTFQLQKFTFGTHQTESTPFNVPPDWLTNRGARWVNVLITLEEDLTEEDLIAEHRLEFLGNTKKNIAFSLHPWVVHGPDADEEEHILARHRLTRRK
jgi:hypothetical protein